MRQNSMRNIKLLILCVFMFTACHADASKRNSSDKRYVNAEYGFAVSLPYGLPHRESPSPAPNHGTVVTLHSGGKIWIDGSYSADFRASIKDELNQILTYENAKPRQAMNSRKLAGLKAMEVSYSKVGKPAIRIVAIRMRGDAVPVIYTLGLDANPMHTNEDKKIFRRIIRSFTLLPLPN